MVLIFPLVFIIGVNFKQTAYFSHGAVGCIPQAFDSDHDGCPELFLTGGGDTGTMVYEHIGNNQYEETKIRGLMILTVDYGDEDTLVDAFGNLIPFPERESLGIYESSTYNSFPDTLVWLCPDVLPQYIAQGVFADFDQDGKMNIITNGGRSSRIYLYENAGDNDYRLKFLYLFPTGISAPYEMVIDDFDSDGLLELVCGDSDGKIYLFENTAIGVDSFQLVWTYELPPYTGAAYMTAKGNDMDRDGRLEFIVGAEASGTGRGVLTIFESNGNNSYQKVWQKIFQYSGNLMTYGAVDCGDIDGDGIDEVVSFIGLTVNVWKCVGPDSFVSIWDRWYMGDLTDGVLEIADLNQNGLGEIIVSGGNWGSTPPAKTYIYEKMPSVTWIYPARYDTLWANDTVNLLWKLDETVSLESLRIYIAHPLMGCWLIYQGLPTDTTCVFVVPDTQSNMAFKFWVAVQGYLRYDSIVSPPFYIKRRTGVEETAGRFTHDALRLEAQPNPFKGKLIIRYTIQDGGEMIQDTRYRVQDINLKIYDVSGRLVKSFNLESYIMYHESVISWDGTDDSGHRLPPGVYFVCLTNGSLSAIKKVIKFGR